MSGERWFTRVSLLTLIIIGLVFIFTLAAMTGDVEDKVDDSNGLLFRLNENQNEKGSWDDEVNVTAIGSLANDINIDTNLGNFRSSGAKVDYEFADGSVICYDSQPRLKSSSKWLVNNTLEVHSNEFASYNLQVRNTDVTYGDYVGYQTMLSDVLIIAQELDGSWNQNVSDTTMAVIGLTAIEEENSITVEKGVDWLIENKDKISRGPIIDEAKTILALKSAKIDVRDEISALKLKQKPDGSFGGIEETSWAVMALSAHPNEETMISMERAVTWLRDQNYDNNNDLAIAALAEQYYGNSKLFDEKEKEGESGFIPPPLLFILSIMIIGSLTLSYWLFARIDRNEKLDGVRKD
ncbi:MAG: hypothetical protein ACXAB7_25175, partial [Candidatus Kariarchaeaceae archaeon]